MRPGVIFPSWGGEAVWSAVSGGWAADYPLQNVADLVRPSKLARASGTGLRTVAAVLPQARPVQAVALVAHNYVPGADTVRLYAFSGTGHDPTADAATMVYDSGAVLWWPDGAEPVDGYASLRLFRLPAAVSARSIRLVLNNTGATPLEIGAIEIGGWWDLPIAPGRTLGFESAEPSVDLAGGAKVAGSARSPRAVSGQVDFMALAEATTTAIDFQKLQDLNAPFVFVQDADDPASWPRTAFLARNQKLDPLVGALYRHDRFRFSFIEHWR